MVFWEGYLDEVQIWNRSMSSAEVFDLYRGAVDKTDNSLVAYYDFEAAAGTDSSGNENHSIVFGDTTTVEMDLPDVGGIIEFELAAKLAWFAEDGVLYQLQKKAFSETAWTDVGAPFFGTGAVTNLYDDLTAPNSMYRVVGGN